MARILIAEHNQSTAHFLTATLKNAGNAVQVVDNCLDAWRLSSRENYDVLMIDIVMPGIDGFVLAQKALQENPSIQIVFITGFAGVAMDSQATPAFSPVPVTTRPFHLKHIVSSVRYLLGMGGMPAHLAPAKGSDNVIYANFTHNAAPHQHAQV